MYKCNKCGKAIRFIKDKSRKTLVVNYNSVYFVPDPNGKLIVAANGSIRNGRIAPDGIKGFTLHKC